MDANKEPKSQEIGTGPDPGASNVVSISADREPLKRLLIRDGQRAIFLPSASIRWLEADGDFVFLHTDGDSYRIRSTLSSLYARLDQNQFLRINRSTIVNLDFVSELRLRNNSDYDVLLQDGTVLRFSRLYRSSFQRLGGVFASPAKAKARRQCS